VVRQLDLFSAPSIAFDRGFRGLVRRPLAHGAWVDHQTGWVAGHDALFDRLEAELDWHLETRRMYDRDVVTPRLLATIDPAAHPVIAAMREALSAHYGVAFVRTTAALYRDGNDSVAWHGDTTARDLDEAIVATISLGQPRRFLLKPLDGGHAIAYPAGRGALIVWGGTCQRTWRHAIPKVAQAGPRIAVMFRPHWEA
jgi:alkylated DNA repair dioxygenase AlkB